MGSRSRLLLVEDDVALRETLGDALDDIGFDVVVACSGAQALAALDAGAAEFKEVITDIDLGAGPDGWDVGRRARERVDDMPVVYISGDDDNNDERGGWLRRDSVSVPLSGSSAGWVRSVPLRGPPCARAPQWR